jgi:hypothetical protein
MEPPAGSRQVSYIRGSLRRNMAKLALTPQGPDFAQNICDTPLLKGRNFSRPKIEPGKSRQTLTQ